MRKSVVNSLWEWFIFYYLAPKFGIEEMFK